MRVLLLLLLIYRLLDAYADFDLDGVDDLYDQCPNSLITDIVNLEGCSIDSLKSLHNFSLTVGESYFFKENNTTKLSATNVELSYMYKMYTFEIKTSYITTLNAISDTYIFGYHTSSFLKNTQLQYGLGLSLPTYKTPASNSNKTDYIATLNLLYSFNEYNLYSGVNFNIINDLDEYIKYQNSSMVYMGIGGYLVQSLYISFFYNNSTSIYKGYEDISNLSGQISYFFDEHYSLLLNYEQSLSQQDFSSSIKLSYYF